MIYRDLYFVDTYHMIQQPLGNKNAYARFSRRLDISRYISPTPPATPPNYFVLVSFHVYLNIMLVFRCLL